MNVKQAMYAPKYWSEPPKGKKEPTVKSYLTINKEDPGISRSHFAMISNDGKLSAEQTIKIKGWQNVDNIMRRDITFTEGDNIIAESSGKKVNVAYTDLNGVKHDPGHETYKKGELTYICEADSSDRLSKSEKELLMALETGLSINKNEPQLKIILDKLQSLNSKLSFSLTDNQINVKDSVGKVLYSSEITNIFSQD